MQDTHLRWMLIVLVSLLILIGFLVFYPNAGIPTAAPHPEYSSMLQSTGPYNPLASWIGVLFGLLLICTMAITMTVGLHRPGKKNTLNTWIIRGLFIYSFVWVFIKLADDIYLESTAPAFWGGFPTPTALLIYGIGLFPLIIIPLYYYYFSKDIYSEEDQSRFEELLKENAEKSGGLD